MKIKIIFRFSLMLHPDMCKLGISKSDYSALITELEVEMFNRLRCSSTTCCAQSFVASGRLRCADIIAMKHVSGME